MKFNKQTNLLDLKKSHGLISSNETKINISKLLDIAKQNLWCNDFTIAKHQSTTVDKFTLPTTKYNTLTHDNLLS